MVDELTAAQLRDLFVLVCQLLTFDALRLTGREKQFALLLASESFGKGSPSGTIGVSTPIQRVTQTGKWCRRLTKWRPSEIWQMFDDWFKAGWVAVDAAEGLFRLCPDNLPGWTDASRTFATELGQDVLPLRTADDLNKSIAKISQLAAADNAKKSQLALGGRGGSVDRSVLDRIDSKEILNSIRLDPDVPEVPSVHSIPIAKKSHLAGDSARGYIEDKLCLPKLHRLRNEMTGGNPHMSRKFVQMLHSDPETLAEWIGEAASPGITDPCKFLNSRLSHHGV